MNSTTAIRTGPVDRMPFEDLIAEGLRRSRDHASSDALAAWRSAIALRPEASLPRFLVGAELAGGGRIDDAERFFAEAVGLEPSFHLARYQLGLLQFTSGRVAVALVTWAPLLELPRGAALRRFVEGFGALAAGAVDAALASFDAGTAANQDNQPVNDDIAKVVAAVRRGTSSGDATASEGAPRSRDAGDAHVLLETYRDNAGLH